MDENDIGREVVDAVITVHRELGPGLLETVYDVILLDKLRRGHEAMMKRGIALAVNGLHE